MARALLTPGSNGGPEPHYLQAEKQGRHTRTLEKGTRVLPDIRVSQVRLGQQSRARKPEVVVTSTASGADHLGYRLGSAIA